MESLPHVVRGVLAYHTRRETRSIRPLDHLYGDLGLTTLGLALVLIDIEDICDLRLPAEPLGALETVGDLLRLVREQAHPEMSEA